MVIFGNVKLLLPELHPFKNEKNVFPLDSFRMKYVNYHMSIIFDRKTLIDISFLKE